jgi:RNA polymerase sigma-70 factor, ECF subfamily
MCKSDFVKQLKAGSNEAFQQLFDQFHLKIINTCYSLVHNQEDAEDITQEVFFEVYLSINHFKEEASLSTWIYRIAINKSLNFLRKRKIKAMFTSLENLLTFKETASIQNNKQGLENDELKKVLHKAIDNLPKKQRIAFMLFKYDDLPQKEIAEIMNCNVNAVEVLIHRAKYNLNKQLKPYQTGKY